VTIVDTTAPSITAPANQFVECGNNLPTPSATAFDSCGDATWTMSESFVADCGSTGVYTRVYTATDECGNTATDSHTITVVDTTAPVIDICPADITIDCANGDISPSNTGGAAASDVCDADVDMSYDDVVISTDCPQTIERTWTATDDCGNTSVCTQLITIIDETAPVVTAPADVTVDCGDSTEPSSTGVASAVDNCSGLEYSYVDAPLTGTCPVILVRTWTATDACGNSASDVQTISITDTTAPVVISSPDNLTIECDATLPAIVAPEFSDNCDATVTVDYTENEVDDACGYTITRTWTAYDDCENITTVTQVITVTDTTSPVFGAYQATLTMECDNIVDTDAPSVLDNCDTEVEVTMVETLNTDFCNGTIVRTWTATDDCGNTSVAVQTITVVDTTAPILTGVPADVTVDCGNIPAVQYPGATDNCDDDVQIDLLSEEVSTGACPYTITRTYLATDACGNTSTASQVITVTDTEAPVIGDYDVTVQVSCDMLDSFTIPATDNCDQDLNFDYTDILFSGSCYGTIERTWIVSDDCGNSATSVQYIFIIDEQAPELFNVPADLTVECDGVVPAVALDVFATDNCDADVDITFVETQSGTDCPYVITRTWTAEDQCGNETTVTQVINVVTTLITDEVMMNVYPNPMVSEAYFTFVVPENGFVKFELVNSLGQRVMDIYEGNAQKDIEYRFNVNVTKLDGGQYTTRIFFEDQVLTKQVIRVN